MTRIRQLTLAALTSLLVAGTALAEPPKVAPPPPGEPVDYVLPAKTRFTLANGIPVTLVPFGEVPKLSIVVRVRTGNIDEGDRTWLADLAGELMKEGTENFTGPEISRRAASLGGSIDVGVGLETSSVSMSALSEKSADAVGLVAEVLRRPVFPASELDRVRNDFLRNLSIAKSQPDGLVSEAFYARAYAGRNARASMSRDDSMPARCAGRSRRASPTGRPGLSRQLPHPARPGKRACRSSTGRAHPSPPSSPACRSRTSRTPGT